MPPLLFFILLVLLLKRKRDGGGISFSLYLPSKRKRALNVVCGPIGHAGLWAT